MAKDDKITLKGKPCKLKIAGHDIDFSKVMPIKTGDMLALENKYEIRLMSGSTEVLNGVKKISQFVFHFANAVNPVIKEEDIYEIPFDQVAWVAQWINANGARDITDPNFSKLHTS